MKQNGFYVSVRKTTVVDVNSESHPLPPDCGPFDEYRVAHYFCPDEWSKDGVFIPVQEGDPMWFDFRQNDECAVLCSIQRANPLTGKPADLDSGLSKDPVQNYMVLPEQRWVDGYSNNGKVYQFVVTKAGEGLAVNEFVLPKQLQDSHAIGFAFFAPKNPKPKNRFAFTPMASPPPLIKKAWISPPETDFYKYYGNKNVADWYHPESKTNGVLRGGIQCSAAVPAESDADDCVHFANMGYIPEARDSENDADTDNRLESFEATQFDKASMGMGGRISQGIVTDPNTVEYYHEKPSAVLIIYLCLQEQFDAIMKKGRRSDSNRKDKFEFSGEVGGIQVPLIKQ